MASLTTGLCFLLAIPIAPVVSAVPPLASGPILCLLGALMCSSVRGIDWDDFEDREFQQSSPLDFLNNILQAFFGFVS